MINGDCGIGPVLCILAVIGTYAGMIWWFSTLVYP